MATDRESGANPPHLALASYCPPLGLPRPLLEADK